MNRSLGLIAALIILAGLSCPPLPALNAATEWEKGDGFRFRNLDYSREGTPGFTLLPGSATGIQFTNTLTIDRALANQNLMNGAGVALGDYDGDGLCDIFLCSLDGHCVLYRNLGNWKFVDATAASGISTANRAVTGATFADVNGDSFPDLIVTACGGPNSCFINHGKGRFTETILPSGEVSRTGSTSIALADIDGDGDLDLYIANYGENSLLRGGGTPATKMVNGREEVVGRYRNRIKIRADGTFIELGEPDVLYLNDGRGNFTPVSWTGGMFLDEEGRPLDQADWDLGLSVMFRDLNGDGLPDIYECNDFQTPDRIRINDGHGHFRAVERFAIRSTSNFAMTVDAADINGDGLMDFFVADMLSQSHRLRMTQIDGSEHTPHLPGDAASRPQIRRNTLFLNRGDGTYAEIANYAGLAASDWTWCSAFLDVDLDGREDLLVANGHAFDTQDLDAIDRGKAMGSVSLAESRKKLLMFPPLLTANAAFRNRGDLTFEEVGERWGFHSTQVSHGIALADLDNDGDLDVVVNCLNAPPLLYRNNAPAPRLAVRLRGLPPNSAGIGAKIKVSAPSLPLQSQEVIAGGRYLSGDDPCRTFATGAATNLTLEVIWRSGQRSLIADARPNRLYEIAEAAAQPAVPVSAPPPPAPWFSDASSLLHHTHHEELFDDFARQPLLPRRFSQLGPGVAWYDLDGDGHDELLVGTGRGGSLSLYRGDGHGLARVDSPALRAAWPDDTTGLAAWVASPGKRSLLIGLACYESGHTNDPPVWQLAMNAQGVVSLQPVAEVLPPPGTSIGPLAVADYDGNGTLDLFVGGRLAPGRYPAAPVSQLYHNDDGTLKLDPANSRVLQTAGMVSGAVWCDLDEDGWPELVLACEWGPVRVYHNDRGTLREITANLGLDAFTGWWQSVAVGDFDGDGRLDLVAGNWGLNSPYQASLAQPARIYYGDLDENGVFDVLEGQWDEASGKVMPVRNKLVVGPALPQVQASYPTHKAYAEAGLAEILGHLPQPAQEGRAATLASMVFLNRGDRFEARPLPMEAQWSPVYGVSVTDVDGDGAEDVLLGQNCFALRAEDSRQDAGRGLVLQGDGRGGFKAVAGQVSGVKVYGEQRGGAWGDYDEDGKMDGVLSQNSGATVLFHNERGKAGVRVKLQGPPGNPAGVGAVVRLRAGERSGPARALQGGGGYWSQESLTVRPASVQPPDTLAIRWPGGKTTTTKIPPNTTELTVDANGSLHSSR